MLGILTRNPMVHAAAILAVVLLCAQTLVVVHDHQTTEAELCAVCSTSADVDTPSRVVVADARPNAIDVPALLSLAPAEGKTAAHQARAPPCA